jgi:hypothetical protein
MRIYMKMLFVYVYVTFGGRTIHKIPSILAPVGNSGVPRISLRFDSSLELTGVLTAQGHRLKSNVKRCIGQCPRKFQTGSFHLSSLVEL